MKKHNHKKGIIGGMLAGAKAKARKSFYNRALLKARENFNNLLAGISLGDPNLTASQGVLNFIKTHPPRYPKSTSLTLKSLEEVWKSLNAQTGPTESPRHVWAEGSANPWHGYNQRIGRILRPEEHKITPAIDHEKLEKIHKAEMCAGQRWDRNTERNIRDIISKRREYAMSLKFYKSDSKSYAILIKSIGNMNEEIKELLNL